MRAITGALLALFLFFLLTVGLFTLDQRLDRIEEALDLHREGIWNSYEGKIPWLPCCGAQFEDDDPSNDRYPTIDQPIGSGR